MGSPGEILRRKPERPGWPWWIKLPLALFCAAVLAATIILMLNQQARNRWYAYAEALRAAGEPLTLDEIELLRPKVADDENAARLLEDLDGAFKALELRSDDWVLVFDHRLRTMDALVGIPRFTLEPSRAFLAKHLELFEKLEALRAVTNGRLSVTYDSRDPFLLLPKLGPFQLGSRLLTLRAWCNVIDGNAARVVADLELVDRITSSLDNEPILMLRILQFRNDEATLDIAEGLLAQGPVDRDSLSRLQAMAERRQAKRGIVDTLRGERAIFIDSCNRLIQGRLDPAVVSSLSLPRLTEWFIRDNQRLGAELYTELIKGGDGGVSLLRSARSVQLRLDGLPSGPAGFGSVIARAFFPAFGSTFKTYATGNARMDCALAAFSAERFRMATGRYPATLDELVPDYLPAVPRDPFNGRPVRMVATAEGMTIYSVGENETDDGGDVARVDGARRWVDVGFRLLRPEHRGIRITDDPPPGE